MKQNLKNIDDTSQVKCTGGHYIIIPHLLFKKVMCENFHNKKSYMFIYKLTG